MELHLVHFNTAYGRNISDAIHNSGDAWDTIVVLGVLFHLQEEDNHNFDFIIKGSNLDTMVVYVEKRTIFENR